MDTVDANFKHEWLDNLEQALGGRKPDYLIVPHMEPDHAANVANFLEVYPLSLIHIFPDAGCKNISGRLRQSQCGKTAGNYSRTDS